MIETIYDTKKEDGLDNLMGGRYYTEIDSFKDIVDILSNGCRVYNDELEMDVIAVSNPIGRGKLFLGDYYTKKVYIIIDEMETMNYSYTIINESE